MGAQDITLRVARLVLELLALKTTARTGWSRAGIPLVAQETVASHTFGATEIAILLAVCTVNGVRLNIGRVAILATLHDVGETRTGDVARPLKEILEEQGLSKEQLDQRAEQLQRQGLPRKLQGFLRNALDEYRRGETLEAKIAHDAQLIDLGVQALLYQRQGYPTRAFAEIENELKTEEGKKLWGIILGDPEIFTDWFSRRP